MTVFDYLLRLAASPNFIVWRRLFAILFIVLLTFALAAVLGKFTNRIFERVIRKKRDHPEHIADTTKFVVLKRVTQVVVYLFGFALIVYSIPEFRAVSYSILAGAGVAAVIIGFAAQKAFSNIMSGIFLAVSEPIRVGDKVTINNHYGTIEDITLRHTIIRTWDNNRVILPNAVMNEVEIINHSIVEESILQTIDLGISYDSDIDKAKEIMTEEIQKHPTFFSQMNHSGYLEPDTTVTVRVMECGDFAVKLRAYFWARDKVSGFVMEKDLIESIKKRFDKEGVEIPFPYRTIVYKKDLRKAKKRKKK